MTHNKTMNNINITITPNKEEFYTWLVGFSEGDVPFFPTKEGKGVRFEIWQTRSDTKVLEYIQSELGFGKIRIPTHRPDMAIYEVSKDEEIEKLKAIFATRMCISRVNSRLNSLLKMSNKCTKPTLNTAYLSGIIDAEGSFWIKQEAKTNMFKFIFEISQKDKQILTEIRSLYTFKPGTSDIYTDGSSWKLRIYSTQVRDELIAYVEKNPLRSHKQQVYIDWKKGLEIKASSAPDKTERLLALKQRLNMWRSTNS